MDNLNTHQSESLVLLIARKLNITEDLGVKGETGILKNMKTRAKFLSDESHRIRIIYTPKHASWLNQIERKITYSTGVAPLLSRTKIFLYLTYLKESALEIS